MITDQKKLDEEFKNQVKVVDDFMEDLSKEIHSLLIEREIDSKQGRTCLDEFKFLKIGCFFKKNNVSSIPLTVLSKKMNVNINTLSRFLTGTNIKYKKLWKWIEDFDYCLKQTFDNFLKLKLNELSFHTIVKVKFYRDNFRRLFGEVAYQKVKHDKYEYEKLKEKIKVDKEFEYEELPSISKDNINIVKSMKKVHILGTTKSSETIKLLADYFDCELPDISLNQMHKNSIYFMTMYPHLNMGRSK